MMEIFRDSSRIPARLRGAFVTIGNFDGVHLGHQYLFGRLLNEARSQGRKTIVITFEPHPKMVLHPERRPFYLITSPEEKIRLVEQSGIDAMLIIPFCLEFAKTTAEEFVRGVLVEQLGIAKIVIGHDYTFGRGKEGNEEFLIAAGRRFGFDVEVMNAFTLEEGPVSSTRIRRALLAGEVELAARLLGRPYNLGGEVIPGKRRGRDLGFPTANIRPEKELLPLAGTYAVFVLFDGQRRPGVLNIGENPTFGSGGLSVEVHILDFEGLLYGRRLDLLFVARLRSELRFATAGDLAAQISKDIIQARQILAKEEGGLQTSGEKPGQ